MAEVSLEYLGAEVQRLQGEVAAVKNAINVLNQDILGVRGGLVGLLKTAESLGDSVEDLGRSVDGIAGGMAILSQEVRLGFAALNARLDKRER